MSTTTDPQAELFYEVDANDQVIGPMPRSEAHDGSKRIHRSIAIMILNQDKTRVLLQKRSLTKDTNPGTWTESCGGHLTYGETYEQAAQKELWEELGRRESIVPCGKTPIEDQREREICMVFQAQIDDQAKFSLHPQELDQVKWVEVSQIENFINTQPFSPCGKQVIKYFFHLK